MDSDQYMTAVFVVIVSLVCKAAEIVLIHNYDFMTGRVAQWRSG